MQYKLLIDGVAIDNVYIDRSLQYNKPAKNVETISVPGRNGDLILDEGTFKNVTISYPAYIRENFEIVWQGLINKLATLKGYHKIQCSDDLTHFRMGRVIIPQTPSVFKVNTGASFSLAFDCKPQRFLTSGQNQYSRTASGSINNPTNYTSQPLLRVYGTGSFTLAGNRVTISYNPDYIDIDCEAMECIGSDGTSMNRFVSFSQVDYPVLNPGSNSLTIGTGITKIEYTPRWWEL